MLGTGQYLTFTIGDEEYGLEILEVQEIRGHFTVTPIPNTAPHVRGVTNLRGAIIPVIDLRARLGLPEAGRGGSPVAVVVRAAGKVMALEVDAVSDVLKLAATEIQPAPDLGHGLDARFVGGLASSGDRLVLLLDLDAVIGAPARETVAVGD
jgi:purine-binding chemotaxis protein CheW